MAPLLISSECGFFTGKKNSFCSRKIALPDFKYIEQSNCWGVLSSAHMIFTRKSQNKANHGIGVHFLGIPYSTIRPRGGRGKIAVNTLGSRMGGEGVSLNAPLTQPNVIFMYCNYGALHSELLWRPSAVSPNAPLMGGRKKGGAPSWNLLYWVSMLQFTQWKGLALSREGPVWPIGNVGRQQPLWC